MQPWRTGFHHVDQAVLRLEAGFLAVVFSRSACFKPSPRRTGVGDACWCAWLLPLSTHCCWRGNLPKEPSPHPQRHVSPSLFQSAINLSILQNSGDKVQLDKENVPVSVQLLLQECSWPDGNTLSTVESAGGGSCCPPVVSRVTTSVTAQLLQRHQETCQGRTEQRKGAW